MPPPEPPPEPLLFAELPEMVESVTVSVPLLLKAPPLLEVCAPETITPEIVRFPPESTLKIQKLPLLPLIVSEEAPGPLMVRVPAVPPPVIGVLALTIVGNEEEPRVMVPVTLKLMMSSPAVVLA